ncbi:endodeoxyribonuclease [Coemansia sp. Benny D115]|nr:endodeoxyribonuclease [Coemansia sp. Benny D115]
MASGQFAYQRDVYYRHKALLKSTDNVRLLCNKLAFCFGVSPARLRIISCPKGLMHGPVSVELNNGTVLEFSKQGDTNTREMLHILAQRVQRIMVLVDCDPDGAHIYQVYAEGGWSQRNFQLLQARWSGLHCSMARIGGRWGLDVSQLIEFTARDRSLALRLLQHWVGNAELRRRMARMLYRGKKAELEAITQYRDMLLGYVASILASSDP